MGIPSKIILLLVAVFLLSACREDPRKILLKGNEMLKQENAAWALRYYQRAFEYSLDKGFLLSHIKDYYSTFSLSASGKWALAVQKDVDMDKVLATGKVAEEKKLSVANSKFIVFDILENSRKTIPYDLPFERADISPNGNYLLIKYKNKDNTCGLWPVDVVEEDILEPMGFPVHCSNTEAISDDGFIYYYVHPHIGRYSVKEKTNVYPYIKKKFPFIIKKTYGKSALGVSPGQKVFFIYGLAGKYSIYEILQKEKEKDPSLELISSAVTYPKIIFMQNEDYPGVLTGGADSYQFIFYKTGKEKKSAYSYPANYWEEVAFYNGENFATIEENLMFYYDLNQKKNQKTKMSLDARYSPGFGMLTGLDEEGKIQLEFWAKNVQIDYNGNIYFRTPNGVIIRWNQSPLAELSRKIYKMSTEIDPES